MSDLKTVKNGLLVIFEGSDGVGKTTQLNLAAEELQSDGWQVETFRHLGGSPMGEALRAVSLSDVARLPETDLYISAAIMNELAAALVQARSRGSIVLLDRGPLSLYAYQVNGSGADPGLGKHFSDMAIELYRPELILLLKADTSTALERARLVSGKSDYFESKPLEYFNRVANGLQKAADWYDATEVDANLPIGDVHSSIMEQIKAKLPLKN